MGQQVEPNQYVPVGSGGFYWFLPWLAASANWHCGSCWLCLSPQLHLSITKFISENSDHDHVMAAVAWLAASFSIGQQIYSESDGCQANLLASRPQAEARRSRSLGPWLLSLERVLARAGDVGGGGFIGVQLLTLARLRSSTFCTSSGWS